MEKNNYLKIRDKYNTIIYHGYALSQDVEKLVIEYDYEILGLERFNPKVIIYKKNLKNITACENFDKIDLDDPVLKNLAFNLGMEDLINYFKLTCPKNILVECGYLDEKQEEWFRKLYINGLGEFFYVNNIPFPENDFITFHSNEEYKNVKVESNKKLYGNLIPVGGGKDSCLTLDILDSLRRDNATFIVETNFYIGAPNDVVLEAGYQSKTIFAKRVLDKKMLELNKKGFLNGHTPFSAMLAFLTNIVAYIAGKKYVVLSNESSANEPTVIDTKINHQYSKSIELENDFRWYCKNYLKSGVEYFSLLRPLTEIQIAKMFFSIGKFRNTFKSCNNGSRENVWCTNCAKCLFVYIMMSPFASDNELIEMFGQNLYEKESLKDIFIDLIGRGKSKPFECVGTIEEINFAICKKIQILKYSTQDLPLLLKFYFERFMKNNIKNVEKYINDNEKDLLYSYNATNNVSGVFEELIKEKIAKGE